MNLLVTGAWRQATEYIPMLRETHDVVFLQNEKDGLPCDPGWVEGIVGNGIFLFHPIEEFSRLKYVQLTSAGYDRVPMDYVKQHKITINNARGVYSVPIAEFAIAGVLQLYKELSAFYENQKARRWEKRRNLKELAGKTVTIVGCGSVGTECAKRFKAFDAEVVGVDAIVRDDARYDAMLEISHLDDVLSHSDVVVVTVPLVNETRNMFDERRLTTLKPGAVLVNVARGGVVDQNALIRQLESNQISAVLDVFEEEPLQEASPLWEMKNVIVTPHNSFIGDGDGKRMSVVVLENLFKYGSFTSKKHND